MMGLAGESLIEANALPALADALMQVRSQQIELAKSLERLEQQTLGDSTIDRSLVNR
ncbi:MAG: hypothetical protein HC895_14790, partial [Leptolyngbyaceae cyanobacterium SM1_3_5]|nr:hypothetical protein [Leptolyngbyaceae cyanobacterium SM1_3_5]